MTRLRPMFLILTAVVAAAVLCLPVPGKSQSGGTVTADSILVLKGERKMHLMRDGKALKTYRISLGKSPVGHKTRRGDNRTPEGRYSIDRRNPNSKYHLSLGISYPNSTDAARARKLGVDPGGNIMIHGLPNGHGPSWEKKRLTDWTAGCIAVTDKEIREIWRMVPVGTPIEIRP